MLTFETPRLASVVDLVRSPGPTFVWGSLTDPATNTVVGRFHRVVHHAGKTVVHAGMEIDELYRGHGLGTAFVRTSVERYQRYGIEAVHLEAGGDSGSYVWAAFGFEWHREDPLALVEDAVRTCPERFDEPQLLLDATANGASPRELSQLGRDHSTDSTWDGKTLMMMLEWKGWLPIPAANATLAAADESAALQPA